MEYNWVKPCRILCYYYLEHFFFISYLAGHKETTHILLLSSILYMCDKNGKKIKINVMETVLKQDRIN